MSSNALACLHCKDMNGIDFRTLMACSIGLGSFTESMITIFEGPGPLHHEVKGSHIWNFESLKKIEIGVENTFK